MKRSTSILTGLLLASASAFAQEAAPAAAPHQETLFQTIIHGGPLLMVIWVTLAATSATMVAFVIQNFFTLRVVKLAPPPLIEALKDSISSGNYQEAWETANANDNYIANVLKAGLARLGRGKEAVEDALSEYGLREATIIRTRNSYLSVIGVVSPMIGLLGTVIGMIKAFSVMGSAGLSNPAGLASSISEVLIATATGLFIAIPAFIFYYFFRNRAQMVVVYADDAVNSLVSELPYEELAGVQIGEKFNPGSPAGAPGAKQSRKVSADLSTVCPVCNGAIQAGQNPCPHCGATLQWQS